MIAFILNILAMNYVIFDTHYFPEKSLWMLVFWNLVWTSVTQSEFDSNDLAPDILMTSNLLPLMRCRLSPAIFDLLPSFGILEKQSSYH